MRRRTQQQTPCDPSLTTPELRGSEGVWAKGKHNRKHSATPTAMYRELPTCHRWAVGPRPALQSGCLPLNFSGNPKGELSIVTGLPARLPRRRRCRGGIARGCRSAIQLRTHTPLPVRYIVYMECAAWREGWQISTGTWGLQCIAALGKMRGCCNAWLFCFAAILCCGVPCRPRQRR